MDGQIEALYRYPVKALSGERLEEVHLLEGETFPHDRSYAIENGPSRFDPDDPQYLPKTNFLTLMRDERLAKLETNFDERDHTLTISRQGREVSRGQLNTATGRQMIEQFFAAFMTEELKGPPRVLSARGHSFSDVAAKCVHIINLNSLDALSHIMNEDIDPLRFRANIHISGFEPWRELNWTDQILKCGECKLKVIEPTVRCNATNVDPRSAERRGSLPSTLMQHFGHMNFGIYAHVIGAGSIVAGDQICLLEG